MVFLGLCLNRLFLPLCRSLGLCGSLFLWEERPFFVLGCCCVFWVSWSLSWLLLRLLGALVAALAAAASPGCPGCCLAAAACPGRSGCCVSGCVLGCIVLIYHDITGTEAERWGPRVFPGAPAVGSVVFPLSSDFSFGIDFCVSLCYFVLGGVFYGLYS